MFARTATLGQDWLHIGKALASRFSLSARCDQRSNSKHKFVQIFEAVSTPVGQMLRCLLVMVVEIVAKMTALEEVARILGNGD